MIILRKYGAATHIYIPIIKRSVVDFAVSADWTPAAGDVKISKDGAAAANVTNLPTAITMGNGAMWDFSLTGTEMEAAKIVITVVDSATKAVEDQAILIDTYGHASAEHAADLDDAVDLGLTNLDATVSSRASQTSVDTIDDFVDTEVAAIKAKTDNLPASFPSNFSSLSIDASGNVKVQDGIKKNTALANFEFLMIDSTDDITPKTGLTFGAGNSQRSIDGGAFADTTNTPAELSAGVYKVDLSAGDLNGDVITLKFTGTGANMCLITIKTTP